MLLNAKIIQLSIVVKLREELTVVQNIDPYFPSMWFSSRKVKKRESLHFYIKYKLEVEPCSLYVS